jgi:hypothetical protein
VISIQVRVYPVIQKPLFGTGRHILHDKH